MSRYSNLNKEERVRLLERREHNTAYGLVWERNDIEPDDAVNADFVVLDPDLESSAGGGAFNNLIIEGDNYDALRFLRMAKICCRTAVSNHKGFAGSHSATDTIG